MHQRIKKVIGYLKDSKLIRNQQDFVERIGYDKSSVSLILNGKRPVSKQFVYSITEAFPFVSGSWIEDESGPMIVADPAVVDNEKGVPYFDVDFVGGFDLQQKGRSLAASYYVNFLPYNIADLWVNVTGRSMEPLISHGDLVALRRLPDWQTFILYGEVYAIVTDLYQTIKKVRRSTVGPDHLLLVPANPDFDEQDIPLNIIRDIYQVIGASKRLI